MAIPTIAQEADVIHELTPALEREIGRIAVLHSRIDNSLFSLVILILQLHKVEGRLVVRDQRINERVDTIQDLLVLKSIFLDFDFAALKLLLEEVGNERDKLIHGLWLRHPTTKKIHLRITKGVWKGRQSHQPKVQRRIWPEGPEYDYTDAIKVTKRLKLALDQVDALGAKFDETLAASPEKFRPLGLLTNPLADRKPKAPRGQRGPSGE